MTDTSILSFLVTGGEGRLKELLADIDYRITRIDVRYTRPTHPLPDSLRIEE
jgi:hypothetical protein